jgi:NADH dehydrogenase [ubiquinone] 1 alpha subcomplex assembly factor 6
MGNLSYCANLVRAHDKDQFLRCLFVPAAQREAMFALFALNAELTHIHHVVTEEMMAQIRYAWWEEGVNALYTGEVPRAHPVLQALASLVMHLPQYMMIALIESYRTHYPELPPDNNARMDELSLQLLQQLCPQAEPAWGKAGNIIEKHRTRYGARGNNWLTLKLLIT